jgi:hypothetical protein
MMMVHIVFSGKTIMASNLVIAASALDDGTRGVCDEAEEDVIPDVCEDS